MFTKPTFVLLVLYVAAVQSTILATSAILNRMARGESGSPLDAASHLGAAALPLLAQMSPLGGGIRAALPIIAPGLPVPMAAPIPLAAPLLPIPLSRGLGPAIAHAGTAMHAMTHSHNMMRGALGHHHHHVPLHHHLPHLG